MTVEINLTHEGERQVDTLNAFSDTNLTHMFYTWPPTLDVKGERWTLGNDALLLLSGDVDDRQTVAADDKPESVFQAFSDRVQTYFSDIGLDFPGPSNQTPEQILRLVWDDFLRLGLIKVETVDEWEMLTVPEL